MPERIIPITPGNIYHIYNRGVNKQKIFFSEKNYQFFIYRLNKFFQEYAICYAYCLMPNHYHLLVKVINELFVPKALHPLMVSYSKAVNNEQGRVGPLFQGRFQAILIEDKIQFLDCVKYIHLNPIKAGLVRTSVEWTHSSYSHYLNIKSDSFIQTADVLSHFEDIQEFREYTEFGCEDYQSKYFFDD